MVSLVLIAWLAFSLSCPGIGWTAVVTAAFMFVCGAFLCGSKLQKLSKSK